MANTRPGKWYLYAFLLKIAVSSAQLSFLRPLNDGREEEKGRQELRRNSYVIECKGRTF